MFAELYHFDLYKHHIRAFLFFYSDCPKDTCMMALPSGFDVHLSAYHQHSRSWRASLPPPETSVQITLWWGGVGWAGRGTESKLQ